MDEPNPQDDASSAAPIVTIPPAPASVPPQPSWLERLPGYTVPLLLLGIPLLFMIAGKIWPSQVYDQIVWRYYWGPIKADAQGVASLTFHGITAHSGYTIVNTASWAVLLGLCLVGIAQLLNRTKTPMDSRLIVAATGWVVAGSVFHVMEDTGLFTAPLQYFFITPPIYLMFAVGGVASLAIGHYLRHVAERAGTAVALQKLWFILAIPVLLYLFLYLRNWGQITHYVSPLLVALFALIPYGMFVVRTQRLGRIDPTNLVGTMSIGWILLSIAYVAEFVRNPWMHSTGQIPAALLAPFLAAGVAFLVAGIAWSQRGKHPALAAAFTQPINILLVGSQMLDAFATAIGIDTGGYSEKHVLSAKVIDWTRNLGAKIGFGPMEHYPTFFGFIPIKFAVSLLVVYYIDVASPADRDRQPVLIGLVKFAIIMVGIGPGIRDFTRMALGV